MLIQEPHLINGVSYLRQLDTKSLYTIFLDSAGVTTDSRVNSPGRIFFALRGESFDGHDFVRQALSNGCAMAVIDKKEAAIPGRTILTGDVLLSLQKLACFHRQQFDIPVMAITGSNGKTTTKEMIRAVLSARYKTLATSGNFNNHIGVPLTLLELDPSHQIAVIEMGANHIGEIESLCNIAMPDHGLITNIGSAHLEGFGSPEGVVKAKSELFRYLKKTGGKAFLNSMRPELVGLSAEIRLDYIPFGTGSENFVSGKLLNSREQLNIEVYTEKFDEPLYLFTGLTGSYNFENVLAAVCTGVYFGVPSGRIKGAIENYIPDNNRSQITVTENNKLLLDAYNANPDSMHAAIVNFFSMPGENKSVILGDMFELGHYAPEEHSKIIKLLKKYGCREVILVGKIFYNSPGARDYLRFETTENLIDWLSANPLRNRFMLLKGSRAIQLEKCVAFL